MKSTTNQQNKFNANQQVKSLTFALGPIAHGVLLAPMSLLAILGNTPDLSHLNVIIARNASLDRII